MSWKLLSAGGIRGVIALAAVVHAAAFALMLHGVEPFATYFYSFAWWPYILVLSCINHSKGRNSLLLDDPREFLWVFLYSTPVWLLFEICNFRLANWHYIGVPAEIYLRWPGYFLAYGTVLPGIFETETLLRNLNVLPKLTGRSLRVTPGLLYRCLAVGVLMVLLSLTRPSLFFPLVWLSLIFLLDPVVYRLEGPTRSLMGQAESGDYAPALRLMAAGMICGLLWEFWNFWAAAKWVYTIPFVEYLKIFEMPLLGFFGFPPFALECYLLYRLLVIFRRQWLPRHRLVPVMAVLLTALYCVGAFVGIDRWTLRNL